MGKVYLVGAGPGDPELLTIRALHIIQMADAILFDRLVSPEVVALAKPSAERIYVGKATDNHTMPQEQISSLLIALAKTGKQVCRLKGGDPFIFGRGGEELEALAEQDIPFEVIPGITAASGCAAYSGIPLTHRDYAHRCTFVTGHARSGDIELDWHNLVGSGQTLVFYMGVRTLPTVTRKLLANGAPADLPAALIEKGTTREQRVIVGTLANLVRLAEHHQIQPPTLIILGEVVKLHSTLAWYKANHAPIVNDQGLLMVSNDLRTCSQVRSEINES